MFATVSMMSNARSSSDSRLPQTAAPASSATSCLLSPASVKTEIPDSGYLPVGVSSLPSPPQQHLPHHQYPPPPHHHHHQPPPHHHHHHHSHHHQQQQQQHLLCSSMIKTEYPGTPGECEPPPGGGNGPTSLPPQSALMTTSSSIVAAATTSVSTSEGAGGQSLSCLPPPPPPPMAMQHSTGAPGLPGGVQHQQQQHQQSQQQQPPPSCHNSLQQLRPVTHPPSAGCLQPPPPPPPMTVGVQHHHGGGGGVVASSAAVSQVQPASLSPYYHPITTAPTSLMPSPHSQQQPQPATACMTTLVDSPRTMPSPSHQRHHSGSALPSPSSHQRHASGGGGGAGGGNAAPLPSPSHQRHLSGSGAGAGASSSSSLVPSSPCSSGSGVGPVPAESTGSVNKSAPSAAASSVADSPEPPDSNTGGSSIKSSFIPCKVCGDKASGYHYGVISCEGCKGFFRRSIQKQIEYKCLRDGKCLVIRLNRNRCQYCRFKKCLSVGMSKDSVRYGRMPRRTRSHDGSSTLVTSGGMGGAAAVTSPQPPQPDQLALYDIILTVSQAHHAFCAFTEDKIKALKKSCYTLVPCGTQLRPDRLDEHRLRMHETLSELFTPSVQQVVEFAKRLPDFASLPQDDQLILIKLGFFEVWLVHAAKLVSINESCFTFHDGRQVHKQELDFVYAPNLVKAMFDFSVHFNHLVLNDTETGLFSAVAMARPDRVGLTHAATVEAIQERLLAALKLQMERNHASEPGLFTAVIAVASELAAVGAQAHQAMMWYRDNWHRTTLPPLYAEIFDIPHPEATPEQQQQVQQMRLQHQQQAAAVMASGAITVQSPTSSGPLEKLG